MPLGFGKKRGGAATQISEGGWGFPTRLAESDVNVNAAGIQILANNPDRVAWEIINNGAGGVRFSSLSNVAATGGRRLGADGGFASMNVRDDGEACVYAQFGTPEGVACSIHVTEIIALAARS